MTERPEIEEFIELTNKPWNEWGMADEDVLRICYYVLDLEHEIKILQDRIALMRSERSPAKVK